MEIWKPIKNHKDIYEVSNLGRVRSIDHYQEQKNRYGTMSTKFYKGRILPMKVSNCGYYRVWLTDGVCSVHRLVAEAFIPNPDNLPQINHKNGRKRDNRANNLEWCNNIDNQIHAIKTGLRPPRKNLIRCVETGQVFRNARFAAEWIEQEFIKNGKEKPRRASSNIRKVCNNKRATAYKYHWENI